MCGFSSQWWIHKCYWFKWFTSVQRDGKWEVRSRFCAIASPSAYAMDGWGQWLLCNPGKALRSRPALVSRSSGWCEGKCWAPVRSDRSLIPSNILVCLCVLTQEGYSPAYPQIRLMTILLWILTWQSFRFPQVMSGLSVYLNLLVKNCQYWGKQPHIGLEKL